MDAKEIIATLSERAQETANVNVVFGEPMEYGDTIIIPVAKIKIGGGGGGGRGRGKRAVGADEDAMESGMGLGIQIATTPLGYIEVKDGNARFVNIVDANKMAAGGMMVAGLALLVIMRAIGWKKMRRWHRKMHARRHYAGA